MMMTWDEAVAAFPSLEAEAVANRTCFCKCGCRAADVDPVNAWGRTVPGLCRECVKSRARNRHERAVSAAYVWEDPEATPARRVRNFVARLVSPDKRAEAEAYVREYGTEGAVFLSTMSERVREGKPLTDAQVEAVLRSRDAERRSAKATFRRALSEQRRASKHVDLTRVVIPTDIDPGFYAVQGDDGAWVVMSIDKPEKGSLRGFIVVKVSVDGVLTKYGVQYPQPYRMTPAMERSGYVQSYRGHMPHLVYELVQNPAAARAAYEELMGRAA